MHGAYSFPVAGFKMRRGECTGSDVTTGVIATLLQCAASCLYNPSCMNFIYKPSTQHCLTRSSVCTVSNTSEVGIFTYDLSMVL